MPRDIAVDDVFRLILPSSPALSPDGTRVAFVVKRVDKKENRYVSHLFVMPAKGGKPRQLTRGVVSDGSPQWSPDGKQLAFVSDRGGVANVWLLPLEGGEPHAVTQLRGGAVGAPQWSPDGRDVYFEHFAMPKETEEERKKKANFKHITTLYHKEDGLGWFRGEYWTIWRANAATGRAAPITPGPHHDRDPRVSPDGKLVAFVSNRRADAETYPDLSSIYVMDRAGKNVREVKGGGAFEAPRWCADSRHLAWVGYEGGPGEWLVHEQSVWCGPVSEKRASTGGPGGAGAAGGTGGARILNPGHDRWVVNMVGSDTSLGGNTTIAVFGDGAKERVAFGSDEDGSYRIYSVSTGGGDVRLEIGGKRAVLGMSIAPKSNAAVFAACTPGDTGELYATTLDGHAATGAAGNGSGASTTQ